MQKTMKIEGMMCQNCVRHVKEALSSVDGVNFVNVSLEKNSATVVAGRDIPDSEFTAVIEKAGYKIVG